MGLKGEGWRVLGWIDMAQDRDRLRTHADAVINFRVL
jgi:hypothetical protein